MDQPDLATLLEETSSSVSLIDVCRLAGWDVIEGPGPAPDLEVLPCFRRVYCRAGVVHIIERNVAYGVAETATAAWGGSSVEVLDIVDGQAIVRLPDGGEETWPWLLGVVPDER